MIGKLLRTSTFRLALIYLVLFGVSAAALLGFVYRSTAVFMREQTDETISAEIGGLAEQYRQGGLIGLSRLIVERSQDLRYGLYLLVGPNGQRVAGNLSGWPSAQKPAQGWFDFAYQRPEGGKLKSHVARGRQILLPGGFQLLVARDVEERQELDRFLKQAIAWSFGLMLLLGLGGGVLMSRNLLQKIDAIDRAGRAIMAGDLSRRVPVRGSGDELDRLSESLNAMLDRIERLLNGLRQVTDNIAHDLRSPLTRMRSRLELTLIGPPDLEAYRNTLERTVSEADALLQTFNALLEIARTEAGVDPEMLSDVDLGALARDVAELYEPVAEEKGVTLATTAEDGLVVRANRHLVSQALANLIDNAVKYTPAGGAIEVTAARCAGDLVLSVSDNGPGIAPADRERVLGRFVRLEAHRSSPGSGLGLSLVKAVAEAHGASLVIEDNHPGLRIGLLFRGGRSGIASRA